MLIMDIQPIVVPGAGGDDALIERLNSAASAARAASIPVINVRVVFREGYPDISESNQIFAPLRSMVDFTDANPATAFHPALQSVGSDIFVVKRRVSAFVGSDLSVILRSLGVKRLVLSGVATSGVVLSTLREAADRDFELVVLSDGCADADEETHRVLLSKVFPSQAVVMTVDQWIDELS